MTPTFLIAITATSVGFITAVIALVHTTPLTMTAFFFLGITGFLVGFVLYAYTVWRELRAKRVL